MKLLPATIDLPISPSSIPDAKIGSPYQNPDGTGVLIKVNNGVAPYSWDSQPPNAGIKGLNFSLPDPNNTSVILLDGTPDNSDAPGNYPFTLTVKDANGNTGTINY